tara:strand:+ start:2599 stop:2799 length:201 start_codon:yes stop_codon:yes gene_type:complete
MPIYKFKCDCCGYEFTVIRKMSDDGEVICENCGSNLTNKMLARTSFSLKGSGWYKDGYSPKSKEKK